MMKSLSYSYDKYRGKPKISLNQTCQTKICCRRRTIRMVNTPMTTLKTKNHNREDNNHSVIYNLGRDILKCKYDT